MTQRQASEGAQEMTDYTALREIEKRLSEATKADRELDFWIARATGIEEASEPDLEFVHFTSNGEFELNFAGGKRGWLGTHVIHRYTASLDAAVALCERVLWGRGLLIGKGRTRPSEPLWGVQILASDENEEQREMPVLAEAEANAPALALCLAIVRALLAKEPPHGK